MDIRTLLGAFGVSNTIQQVKNSGNRWVYVCCSRNATNCRDSSAAWTKNRFRWYRVGFEGPWGTEVCVMPLSEAYQAGQRDKRLLSWHFKTISFPQGISLPCP